MATEVNYRLFTLDDADEVCRLLGHAFADGDPPAVAVGLSATEFEAFVRLYCEKAAAEGLTIVARSALTGEMIGALLAEDSAGEPPAGLDRVSAKFHPIFDLLGQLDAEYRRGRATPSGHSVHLLLLGVAEGFAGKGVAQQLVATCLANGLRKGYRLAVTEATNTRSQHVFRKQGFADRVRRTLPGPSVWRPHVLQQRLRAGRTDPDGPKPGRVIVAGRRGRPLAGPLRT